MMPVKSETADLCTELNKNNEEVMTNLRLIDLPRECPFPKVNSLFPCFSDELPDNSVFSQGTRCADGSQILKKKKKYLSFLQGREDISLNIAHDTV